MNFQMSPWLEPSVPRQADHDQHRKGDDDDSLFDLAFGLVGTLWRWRLLIVALIAAGIFLTWFSLQSIPSTYVARAEVFFDFSRQTAVSDLPAATVAPSDKMLNTEMAILTSRNQMDVVVEEFNLTEDPEFNPWLVEPGEAETDDSATASQEEVQVNPLSALINRVAEALNLAEAPAPDSEAVEPEVVDSTTPSEEKIRATAVSFLLNQVDVRLVPDSYVFSITVETLSPEKSAAIANGIADLFIAARDKRRGNASESAVSWLEDRTSNLRDRVREGEAQVANLRVLSSPGGASDIRATAARIAYLREREATLGARSRYISDLSARLADVSAESGLDAETSADLAEFAADLMPRLEAALAAGDSNLVASVIDEARTRVTASAADVRGEAVRTQTELDGLLEVYNELTAEAQVLRDAEREAAASLAAYEALLERLKNQISIGALDPFWPEATVISPAVPPGFPSYPNRELILALGGLGGLAVASALAFLFTALFPALSSPREVARATGVPVLVEIPLPRSARLSKVQRRLRRRPRSPMSDAMRALRNAVALESGGPGPHILVLTSAENRRGKRTVGYMLAQSFAQGGRKALLFDADSETVARYGNTAAGKERGSILYGETDPKNAITRDPDSGVDILIAPEALRDNTDLFGYGTEERNRLEKIGADYDLVVVVAPSVGSLSDARIFALLADSVLVFVRRHRSRPADVSSALNMLSNAKASRIATVWLS